jgi:hypothetical protein
MSYITHAKREFLKLGYKPVNKCEEGPDKWIQETIFKLLKELSKQGHSGGSIGYAMYFFKQMAESKFKDYIEDAKKEFIKIGYKPIEECEDDPDKWIQRDTLKLLKIFSEGYKDQKVIDYFYKLGKQEPISPIMCTDDEWNDVGGLGIPGSNTFQNNRCSAVFKEGIDGKPYYLDAIVFRGENDNTFTSNSVLNSRREKIASKQFIKIPFEPKAYYIDVIETEWADSSETVQKKGGGWWTSIIKDEKQLKEVWKYYERPETLTYSRLKKLNKIDGINIK